MLRRSDGAGSTAHGRTQHNRFGKTAVLLILLLASASTARAEFSVWGVDEDDGELFEVEDYSMHSGITVHGELLFEDSSIGEDIESFAIDPFDDGIAYMVVNRDLNGDSTSQDLVSYALDMAGSDLNVSFIGSLGIGEVNGLSFDPISGHLFGASELGSTSTADLLYRIDKSDGSVEIVGTLSDGDGNVAGKHEDIAFDSDGTLYVTDNEDDELYSVEIPDEADWSIGLDLISSVVDDDQGDDLPVSPKVEALFWDPNEGRMVGVNSEGDEDGFFMEQTLADGGNSVFPGPGESSGLGILYEFGLTDVEGADYDPRGGAPLPEPSTGAIFLVIGSLCGLWHRRSRKRDT